MIWDIYCVSKQANQQRCVSLGFQCHNSYSADAKCQSGMCVKPSALGLCYGIGVCPSSADISMPFHVSLRWQQCCLCVEHMCSLHLLTGESYYTAAWSTVTLLQRWGVCYLERSTSYPQHMQGQHKATSSEFAVGLRLLSALFSRKFVYSSFQILEGFPSFPLCHHICSLLPPFFCLWSSFPLSFVPQSCIYVQTLSLILLPDTWSHSVTFLDLLGIFLLPPSDICSLSLKTLTYQLCVHFYP